MKGTFESFPRAARLILRDPINFLLALIPTLLALSIYILAITMIFRHSDQFGLLLQSYLPDPSYAGWIGKILTVIFVIFIFLLMSWTYVIVVGIIAAPFNSMLSARIEDIMLGKRLDENKGRTFSQLVRNLGSTFKAEFLKLFFILLLTGLAFLLNLFPFFYPIGVFILAVLVSVQFVDYSWARHELSFGACVKDVFRNLIPYSVGGLFFLLLTAIPILNALVPAFGTSYFTVLWLRRQGRIPA